MALTLSILTLYLGILEPNKIAASQLFNHRKVNHWLLMLGWGLRQRLPLLALNHLSNSQLPWS